MSNKVLVILPINKLAYTVNVWWMSFYQNNRDIKQPYIKYKYFNIRAGWYIEIKLEGKLVKLLKTTIKFNYLFINTLF